MLGEVYVRVANVSTQAGFRLERKSRFSLFSRAIATISGSGQDAGEMRARGCLFIKKSKTQSGGLSGTFANPCQFTLRKKNGEPKFPVRNGASETISLSRSAVQTDGGCRS